MGGRVLEVVGRDLAFVAKSRQICGRPQKRAISCSAGDWFCSSVLVPGILHKGNGENQFVSQQPPVIGSIMGNGRRRSISCPSCNGLADGNKLLAPVALTCGSDGSLYVGDFNYIRRIFPSGNVTNILELRYVTFANTVPWLSRGAHLALPTTPRGTSAVRVQSKTSHSPAQC